MAPGGPYTKHKTKLKIFRIELQDFGNMGETYHRSWQPSWSLFTLEVNDKDQTKRGLRMGGDREWSLQ